MNGPWNHEHMEAHALGQLWVLGPEHQPRRVKTFEEWAAAQSAHLRVVDFDDLGDCEVSTVFLGIDHSGMMKGQPVLFETAIFWKDRVEIPRRYHTWQQAQEGHEQVLAELKGRKL